MSCHSYIEYYLLDRDIKWTIQQNCNNIIFEYLNPQKKKMSYILDGCEQRKYFGYNSVTFNY